MDRPSLRDVTPDAPSSGRPTLRDLADGRERALAGLALVTLLALVARLWALGWRVAHQDEARVAAWTLRYMEIGAWEYRAIIHGPFLPHVNGAVFSLFGPTDFTMRVVVALIGGLFPLAAWLFREHLNDAELLGVALFAAANPLLLYYSRFFRNDLLLGAFMVTAFGFYVRAYDTGLARYLYAGTFFFTLGFTVKENALVYAVTWVGAAGLLLDARLFRAAIADRPLWPVVWEGLEEAAWAAWRWAVPLVVAFLEFLLVFFLFYAPKGGGAYPWSDAEGVGLWMAFRDPTLFPAVAREAFLGTWDKFGYWLNSTHQHAYLPYFETFLAVLTAGALALLAFSLVGFVWDRYAGDRQRNVVAFTFYWGAASVGGYPIISDNPFPWEMVHVAAPLVVPAGVGVALVYRRGRTALDRTEAPSVAAAGAGLLVGAASVAVLSGWSVPGSPPTLAGAAGLVALALAGAALAKVRGRDALPGPEAVVAAAAVLVLVATAVQVGLAAHDTSFQRAQAPDNRLVQYAQPAGEMKGTLQDVYRLSEANRGTDVLYYGSIEPRDGGDLYLLYSDTDAWTAGTPPRGWFSRLPLPWYFDAHDVNRSYTTNRSDVRSDPPPVVIAFAEGSRDDPSNHAGDLLDLPSLEGYDVRYHEQFLADREFVFFVRESGDA